MINTNLLLKNYYDFVWRSDPRALPKSQRALVDSLRVTHLVVRDFLDGMLTLQAMSLVYTTLLSIVPLLAVSFSVLKGFGVHNQIEPMLLNLLQPLGEQGVEITDKIIGFVDNIKVGVLGSLGLALLFYTVVSLIQKIERSFNYTWRVTEHRPFAQRFSDYLSVVLLGPLLIFTALGVTASANSSAVLQHLYEYEAVDWVIRIIGRLLPYLLVIIAFTIVYIFVPNTRVKFKPALIAAVVSGVLWETAGWVFASFVVSSAKYAAIYSAFATLIIFMIWLYVCWMILLIGASIAFYVQYPEYRTLQKRRFVLSNRMKEHIALLVMSIISGNYYKSRDPLAIEQVARFMNITPQILMPIVDQLIENKLIVSTNGSKAGLLPAQPPEEQKVIEILRVIRKAEEHGSSSLEMLPKYESIEALYAKMNSALDQGFGDVTLKEISIREPYQPQTGYSNDVVKEMQNDGKAQD